MIIVRFTSGLGNQMFQYNLYRLLQETYPDTQVKADLTWFYANNDHFGFELYKLFAREGSDFSITEASTKEIFHVTGLLPNCSPKHGKSFEKFRRYPNRILKMFSGKKRAGNILDRMSAEISYEQVMSLDVSKDWYLIGFWIEECYWKNRIPSLQKELQFDTNYSVENQKMIKEIRGESLGAEEEVSVSIHVRRGDYLTIYKDQFKEVGREFYESAVKKLLERYSVDRLRFFLFSDDSDFVREAFDWLPNKAVVAINQGDNSFRDMQLMSLCKHNIVANSTFSTWASILNRNEGHMTFYPAAYLIDEDSEVKTVEGWIRL